MDERIPRAALAIMDRLCENGYEAYLVGGSVRDLLRGKEPDDFDITTSATPKEMLSIFSDHRVIPTGLKHGTLTVLRDGAAFEITTYRIDGEYADGRRPSAVSFTRSLREDLARRDFTVNAIAYRPERGVIDPFGGKGDLSARIIRAVGDPWRRFTEDALRILRAIRFSSTLGYAIEAETEAAACALSERLSLVSSERIRVELVKLLLGYDAERVLLTYPKILFSAVPLLSEIGSAWDYAVHRAAILPREPALRLAALLSPLGARKAESVLSSLRFDGATRRRVVSAIAALATPLPSSEFALLGALSSLGKEVLFDRLALETDRAAAESLGENLRRILDEGIPYSVSMLAIGGEALIRLGIPPGKELGKLLSEILSAVMARKIKNSEEELLDFVKRKLKND